MLRLLIISYAPPPLSSKLCFDGPCCTHKLCKQEMDFVSLSIAAWGEFFSVPWNQLPELARTSLLGLPCFVSHGRHGHWALAWMDWSDWCPPANVQSGLISTVNMYAACTHVARLASTI